jgi:hypothetical protein
MHKPGSVTLPPLTAGPHQQRLDLITIVATFGVVIHWRNWRSGSQQASSRDRDDRPLRRSASSMSQPAHPAGCAG